MTADDYERIVATIYDRPWADPGRVESCLAEALGALGEVALSIDAPKAEALACKALRRMEQRCLIGEWQYEDADA